MIKNGLIVCTDPELGRSIQYWLSEMFRSTEFQSYIECPVVDMRVSGDRLQNSIKCDIAIFYNPSKIYGLEGSQKIVQLCEQYVVNNPDCFVNYHYTEQRFFPESLELLRAKFPLLHFMASYVPGNVVRDMVRVVQQHDINQVQKKISAANAVSSGVTEEMYGTPAD